MSQTLDSANQRGDCGSRGDTSRWYCCWTHPNEERRAFDGLANAWETYLPLHLTPGNRVNHRPDRVGALFPRYLFVRFDAGTDQWGAIAYARGVGGIIRHGPRSPTPVSPGCVELLIARTSARGIVDDPGETTGRHVDIPLGAAVTVVGGAFHGLSGIVALSAPDRCRVLLSLFSASVPVNVRTADLQVNA